MPRKSIVGELKDQVEEAGAGTNSPVRRSSRISLRRASTEESIQPQVSTPKATVRTRRASLTQEASEAPQEQAKPTPRGRRGSTSSRTEDTEHTKIDEKPTTAPLGNRPMTRRRSASLDIDVTAPAEVIPPSSAAAKRKSVPNSEASSEPATTGGTPVKKAPVDSKIAVFDSIEEAENEVIDAAAATTTTTNAPKRKKTDPDLNLSVINESLSEEQTSFKEDSPPKTVPDVRVSPRKSTPQKGQEVKVVAAATPRQKLFEGGDSVKESPQIASPKKTTPRVSPRKSPASVSDNKVGTPKKLPLILEESAKQGEIESGSQEMSVDSQQETSLDSQEKTSVDSEEKTSVSPQEKTSVSPQEKTSVSPQEKTSVSPQEKTSVSPQEKTSVSPQGKISVSPQEKTSVSPQEKTSVGPQEKTSVSPQEKNSVSPQGKISVSPQEKTSVNSKLETTSVSPQRSSLRISLKKSVENPLKEATPQKTDSKSDEAPPKTTSEGPNGTSSPVVCWSPRKQLSVTSPQKADVACESPATISDTLDSSQTSDSMHFSLAETPNSSIISNKENITPEASPIKAKTATKNVFASELDAPINLEPCEPMEVDETVLETSATVQSDMPTVEVQPKMSATMLHNLKVAEDINKQVSEMIGHGEKTGKFATPKLAREARSSSKLCESVVESLSKTIERSGSTPKKNDSCSSPAMTADKSPQSDALKPKAEALGKSPLAKRDLTPAKKVEEKQDVVDISDDSSNAEDIAKQAVVDISDESSNVEDIVDCSEGESRKENKSPSKTINFSSDHMNVTGDTEEDKASDDQDQGEVKAVEDEPNQEQSSEDEPSQDKASDEEKAIDAKDQASEHVPSDEEIETAGEKEICQTQNTIRVDLHRTEGYVKEVTDSDASNEEVVTGKDFLDDMAEVQTDPESEASHDSNEINDFGEDVGFDDSEASSIGTYDDGDSFIDDQVVEDLLSGDEYDLDQAKPKPKKSRIIHPASDAEVINTKKPRVRPIPSSSSNSDRLTDLCDDQSDRVETDAGTKVRQALSVEDLTGSSYDDSQQPKKKKKKNRRKKKKTAPIDMPTLSQSSADDNKESLKRKLKSTAEKPAAKKAKYEEREDSANEDEDQQKEAKTRRTIRKKKKSKKSKEVGTKVEEPKTLNIVNEALRRKKMSRLTDAKSTAEWNVTAVALKPFTSDLEVPEVKLKFHPKDYKNQMLYDSKRVKRVETAKMLKKRGG